MKSLGSATKNAAHAVEKSVDTAADAVSDSPSDTDYRTTNARVVSVSVAHGTLTLAYENGDQQVLPISVEDRSLAGNLSVGDEVTVRSQSGQIIEVHRR